MSIGDSSTPGCFAGAQPLRLRGPGRQRLGVDAQPLGHRLGKPDFVYPYDASDRLREDLGRIGRGVAGRARRLVARSSGRCAAAPSATGLTRGFSVCHSGNSDSGGGRFSGGVAFFPCSVHSGRHLCSLCDDSVTPGYSDSGGGAGENFPRRAHGAINRLIQEVMREPFAGVGKPEPLRHALSGFWSRRITDEHRMVYRVDGEDLLIAQLRYHY
jgi:toxin YoeB